MLLNVPNVLNLSSGKAHPIQSITVHVNLHATSHKGLFHWMIIVTGGHFWCCRYTACVCMCVRVVHELLFKSMLFLKASGSDLTISVTTLSRRVCLVANMYKWGLQLLRRQQVMVGKLPGGGHWYRVTFDRLWRRLYCCWCVCTLPAGTITQTTVLSYY